MKTNMHLADQLGAVNAQIADLEKIAKKIKAEFTAKGDGNYEGDLFRVTVTTYDYDSTDWKAIKEKISHQLFNAHTVTKSTTRVGAKAKTGEDVAA